MVIDAINYYPDRDGAAPALDTRQEATSELVADHLPSSHVVKAFNAIPAKDLEKDARRVGAADRRALPLAGDNHDAKMRVIDLVDQLASSMAYRLVKNKKMEVDMAIAEARVKNPKAIEKIKDRIAHDAEFKEKGDISKPDSKAPFSTDKTNCIKALHNMRSGEEARYAPIDCGVEDEILRSYLQQVEDGDLTFSRALQKINDWKPSEPEEA